MSIRMFAMFLLSLGWFFAAPVSADDPDYQKAGALALELQERAYETVIPLATSIPESNRYAAERNSLRLEAGSVANDSHRIVLYTPGGDARRDLMLGFARDIRAAVEVMEDTAESLDDKADRDDDDATERIARKIRWHVRGLEKAARRLQKELD